MHGVNSDLVLKMFFKGIKNLHYKSSHLLYCIGGAKLKVKTIRNLFQMTRKYIIAIMLYGATYYKTITIRHQLACFPFNKSFKKKVYRLSVTLIL